MTPSTHQMREAIELELAENRKLSKGAVEFDFQAFVVAQERRLLAALTALPAASVPPAETGTPETDLPPFCMKCGELMKHNVPRMGPAGGWVHKFTGTLECDPNFVGAIERVTGTLRAQLAEAQERLLTSEHFKEEASKTCYAHLAKIRELEARLTPSPDWARAAAEEILALYKERPVDPIYFHLHRWNEKELAAIISRHAGGRAADMVEIGPELAADILQRRPDLIPSLKSSDTARLDWLEKTGFTVAKDVGHSGALTVWACFEAYPDKPESTNNPFPMFASARAAIDAAITLHANPARNPIT